jgi:hypothetical protein
MPREVLPFNLSFTNHCETPLDLARRFTNEHRDALLNASQLLGGAQARRRCQNLYRGLREASALSRQLKRELVDLHKLLMLERTGDPEAVEIGRGRRDPSPDPTVEPNPLRLLERYRTRALQGYFQFVLAVRPRHRVRLSTLRHSSQVRRRTAARGLVGLPSQPVSRPPVGEDDRAVLLPLPDSGRTGPRAGRRLQRALSLTRAVFHRSD